MQTLRDYEIDTIVNFAAESHNSYAITNPGVFFQTNVVGTQRLCEAVRRVGVEKFHRFHHVSTCEVYGDLALDATEPFNESSPYAPRTPYNASKAGGDHAVRAYYETFDLPITITNCANNYGPYQFPEKVIPLFTTRALERPGHPAVRVDPEPPGVDPRRRSLPRDRAHPRRRTRRRDVPRRYRRGAQHRGDRRRRARGARQARLAQDRSFPTGPVTTAATCSTRRRSGPSSVGSRRSASRPGSARPSSGTPRIATGGSRCSHVRRSTRPQRPGNDGLEVRLARSRHRRGRHGRPRSRRSVGAARGRRPRPRRSTSATATPCSARSARSGPTRSCTARR